jgi:hypothetical protein
MTSPELPCNMRGRPVDELLCTSPITAGFGIRVEHEVTNEAFTASRGEYEALCGCVFLPAPLVAPPGRPCQACLDVRTAARRAAAARRRPCHRRIGLLRRLVPLGKRQRTSTEKDITQWRCSNGPVPGRSLWPSEVDHLGHPGHWHARGERANRQAHRGQAGACRFC